MSLTTVKRSRLSDRTPVATHSFNLVKRPRPNNTSPGGAPFRQHNAPKHSILASTYGLLTLRSQSKAKSRPDTQLGVELPPKLSLPSFGFSPVTSFLTLTYSPDTHFNTPSYADFEGTEDVDQRESRNEHLNYRIIQGVKYDVYPRNEVPYSMLYDEVTPENELHSYELMRKLTKNDSPSFLHVPALLPIRSALDLGCGDGHWVAHAAEVWGVCGTKITGIDIPLSTEGEQKRISVEITENIKILSHNFVTERLPFPDNSFDYVRLNDAVTTIAGERWDFVLSEVYRVLCRGGSFELIHDQPCFSSISPDTPVSCTFAPSASGADSRSHMREAGKNAMSPGSKPGPYEDWKLEMRNCSVVERLYLDMLAQRYGVHPQPRSILVDAIQRRFGRASPIKVSNAHVCLPSQDFMARSRDAPQQKKDAAPKKREVGFSITIDWGPERRSKTMVVGKPPAPAPQPPPPPECLSLTNLPPVLSKKAAKLMGVVQLSPAGAPYQHTGVVVVHSSPEGARRPMMFLPMSPTKLEMHSNKHVHSVVSAKHALEAHIDELQENGEPTMSHDDLDDALWQYAMFRRKRFNWPEEMHPFEWESDSESEDGGSEEQVSREDITLPDTQTTDGLIPIRLFEIFEVIKCP